MTSLGRWLALLLVAVAPAAAQVIHGSLAGNVRDASDASVPGAVVRITQTPHSLARPMRTNYPMMVVPNISRPNCFPPAGCATASCCCAHSTRATGMRRRNHNEERAD